MKAAFPTELTRANNRERIGSGVSVEVYVLGGQTQAAKGCTGSEDINAMSDPERFVIPHVLPDTW